MKKVVWLVHFLVPNVSNSLPTAQYVPVVISYLMLLATRHALLDFMGILQPRIVKNATLSVLPVLDPWLLIVHPVTADTTCFL